MSTPPAAPSPSPSPQGPVSGSVWRVPGMPLLVAMTVLAFSGYAALLPVAPLWAVHGGAGSVGAGLVNGVLMLVTVLTQLVVPTALRRLGWGPVLAAGMLLLGLPSATLGLSDGLLPVLAVSAVRGIGFGVVTVTGSALVAELVAPARRGAAIGAYGLAIAGPQVLLLSAGPWIVEQLGYGLVFALGVLPALGAVPAVLLARRLEHVPEATGRVPYLRLLRPMALLLAVTLAGGALITFMAQMSSSAALSTVALLLLTVAAAVARWRVGALADRFGPRPFLGPLVLLTGAGMAMIAWAVRDPQATAVVPLLLGAAVVGISYGGLQNLTLVLSFRTVSRPHYGSASAVWNIGFDAGTGLGAVVVGMVAAWSSFTTALLVAGAVSLLTLPLALLRRGTGEG
ncbi:MFS transporter [Georgenia satyanarayanai]|uniref:MFS transporter n=1 Tax=Georgenia satyanarayanai TaxID=860221 RepID=UPI0020421CCB|nr:MFS transporter [Georgenia satyanarayanai]MCM3660536.1 MFS transporter [Georgenia satyanarayanai]